MKKSFNEDWEKIHAARTWGAYPSEPVIRFVARNYYNTEKEKIKILDFGCGGGAHTWFLAREGFDTYAFDGSVSAIKRVEQKLKQENLRAQLDIMDALQIDYEDNYFDAVIDNVCIYANLLKDIKEMYAKIYRILKPAEKLFTTCFGKETGGYGTGRELEKGTYVDITEGPLVDRGTTHFFGRDELFDILQEAGFKDINIDYSLYTDNQTKVQHYIATAVKN